MSDDKQGERVAIVETKVDHIITLLEDHVKQPSCGECNLRDDVAVVQNNIMWIKRVGYTLTAVFSTIFGIGKLG